MTLMIFQNLFFFFFFSMLRAGSYSTLSLFVGSLARLIAMSMFAILPPESDHSGAEYKRELNASVGSSRWDSLGSQLL